MLEYRVRWGNRSPLMCGLVSGIYKNCCHPEVCHEGGDAVRVVALSGIRAPNWIALPYRCYVLLHLSSS